MGLNCQLSVFFQKKIIHTNTLNLVKLNITFIILSQQFTTWGFTAVVNILLSSMIHSRLPEYIFDPEIQLTDENKRDYLDMFLD